MSLYFTGYDEPNGSHPTYSHLVVPTANQSGFNFGYNDFTIEWWQNLERSYIIDDQYPHVFACGYRDGFTHLAVSFEHDTMIYWENVAYNSTSYHSIPLPSDSITSRWVHFSINRVKYPWKATCVTRIFMNGQQIGYLESRENINFIGDYPSNLYIGNQSEDWHTYCAFQGYITDFKIINGTCLHQSPFSPPLQPSYPTQNTILLLMGTENGELSTDDSNDTGLPADFYGTVGASVYSKYTSLSGVQHRVALPDGFNIMFNYPSNINIDIARIKKSPLFSGQFYSAVLRRINSNTKIEVGQTWANSYYVKNEQEQNSRNQALRRARAGGANVPKKVTKILTAQSMFSN